jgi:hypothetical protein
MKKILIGLVIVLGVAGLFLPAGRTILSGVYHTVQEDFKAGISVDGTEVISGTGGASFTTITSSSNVNVQDFVQGGGVVTLTSSATTAISAANVCGYNVIKHQPTGGSAAASTSLPTAAALAAITNCLTEAGDFKDIIFWNTGSTASTTVFSTSTGIRLFLEDDTGADATISGGSRATLRFIRSDEGSSTTVDVYLVERTPL